MLWRVRLDDCESKWIRFACELLVGVDFSDRPRAIGIVGHRHVDAALAVREKARARAEFAVVAMAIFGIALGSEFRKQRGNIDSGTEAGSRCLITGFPRCKQLLGSSFLIRKGKYQCGGRGCSGRRGGRGGRGDHGDHGGDGCSCGCRRCRWRGCRASRRR